MVRALRKDRLGPLALSFLIAAGLGAPRPAEAACGRLRLQSMGTVDWQGGSGANYSIFDPTEYVYPATFEVQKSRGGTCSYTIGINEGGSGSYDPRQLTRAGNPLDYNIYDKPAKSNVLKDIPAGGPVITGAFSDAGSRTSARARVGLGPTDAAGGQLHPLL